MQAKLIQLEQRIHDLEELAGEVYMLANELLEGKPVQPRFSVRGQRWYRGARELLVQQGFSGLHEFEECYVRHVDAGAGRGGRWHTDIEQHIQRKQASFDQHKLFDECFQKARSLLAAAVEEVRSRELPVRTQLSLAVAATEFETAQALLDSTRDESIVRAAGVVARVALERHLLTVTETRSITIEVNPPHKKKADVSDVLTTLVNHNVITPVQRSEFDSLFSVGNNCAHPKEAIKVVDVQRLIYRGRELASMIV